MGLHGKKPMRQAKVGEHAVTMGVVVDLTLAVVWARAPKEVMSK